MNLELTPMLLQRFCLGSVRLQEVKAGDAPRTRALLSRATSLGLPPKKMKVLFRRWLEYEQAHGSAADVAAVKQRAVEYMESQALRND
jgi:rRNA biogenesis protein RRP5